MPPAGPVVTAAGRLPWVPALPRLPHKAPAVLQRRGRLVDGVQRFLQQALLIEVPVVDLLLRLHDLVMGNAQGAHCVFTHVAIPPK